MPNYLAPGVYVEEVPSGARPIEAVGTSTAGFVGVAPLATAFPHEARAINNWGQFLKEFVPPANAVSTPLAQAVHGFFLNGGSRCYVVNVGPAGPLTGDARGRKGLDVLEAIDEIAIVAAPGYSDAAAYDAVLSHCERLGDRVAILDAPEKVPSINALTQVAGAPAPAPAPAPGGRRGESGGAAGGAGAGTGAAPAGCRPRQSDRGYGAFYFPYLRIRDPLNSAEIVNAPPSGHLAGIYARTDATRGVHKAPANEIIRGALDVAYHLTRQEQEELNPEGINCIRFFGREGVRVYGARTVAPSSSEWRYLNVRRLFNMAEESIARSTRWVVFEPNDRPLWKAIRRDISAFLTLLWRQGALMGRTPEEAFFVQCDEETNTQEEIDAGRVVAVIGLAPVKPAEFVIFRIGQWAGGTQIENKS
jgi:phage tail sheath protein FI